MQGQEIKCRIAPSLGGGFAGTPEEVWGTCVYNPETDSHKPTVFFGLYGFPDFYALWRHKGKKWVLWAGTDVSHFVSGYWLDDMGRIRIPPHALAKWINENCESWVENHVEMEALKKLGIHSEVCPSFLGDVNKFEVSFTPGNKLYTSVSGDDFELYGWDRIDALARQNPEIDFYLYGNTEEWNVLQKNVIVRGRVSQDQMNEETKHMQGALRLTVMDGFSEILAKSILWGQWPVSFIEYPHMVSVKEIRKTLCQENPNIKGRDYYLSKLNQFPWNTR